MRWDFSCVVDLQWLPLFLRVAVEPFLWQILHGAPLCTTAGTADWSRETGSPAHLPSGVALRTSLTTLLS